MPLKSGKPPEKAVQAIAEAVQNLAASPNETMASAMSDAPGGADLTAPLQVYTLGLDDVAAKDLKKAKATGWRYLVLSGDEPVAAAEVNAPSKTKVQFSHFNTGPFVEETARTILQAEGLAAVEKSDYEARILKIPALYVMALWLHNAKDDILIPMPPTNEKLEAKKTYAPKDFFAKLSAAADSRSDFDDTPREVIKS